MKNRNVSDPAVQVAPSVAGCIGDPPSRLTREEGQIWREIVDECPPGVLKSYDRLGLAVYCRIEARIRAGNAPEGFEAEAGAWLEEFGMTPAARVRMGIAG